MADQSLLDCGPAFEEKIAMYVRMDLQVFDRDKHDLSYVVMCSVI